MNTKFLLAFLLFALIGAVFARGASRLGGGRPGSNFHPGQLRPGLRYAEGSKVGSARAGMKGAGKGGK
jgi:hypothetical protein